MSDPSLKSRARGHSGKGQRVPSRSRTEHKPAVNPIKKRIRDLNRLLEHKESLPADVRLNYERELASCRHDVENAQRARNRSRMIQKYHMVRFFERKRATKLLKRARMRLSQEASPEDREILTAKVHACEVDLNYTLYYPLHMVYTSLYTGKQADKKSDTAKRDGVMWVVVERAMASGCLQELREGKLEGYRDDDLHDDKAVKMEAKLSKQASSKALSSAPRSNQAGNKDNDDENDNDDDDGAGFFE